MERTTGLFQQGHTTDQLFAKTRHPLIANEPYTAPLLKWYTTTLALPAVHVAGWGAPVAKPT
jgi:acyl-homoserine lactone acylase PvdQ